LTWRVIFNLKSLKIIKMSEQVGSQICINLKSTRELNVDSVLNFFLNLKKNISYDTLY
jgi:hypothetical protein